MSKSDGADDAHLETIAGAEQFIREVIFPGLCERVADSGGINPVAFILSWTDPSTRHRFPQAMALVCEVRDGDTNETFEAEIVRRCRIVGAFGLVMCCHVSYVAVDPHDRARHEALRAKNWIVDDEPDAQEAVMITLEHRGFDVENDIMVWSARLITEEGGATKLGPLELAVNTDVRTTGVSQRYLPPKSDVPEVNVGAVFRA